MAVILLKYSLFRNVREDLELCLSNVNKIGNIYSLPGNIKLLTFVTSHSIVDCTMNVRMT